MARTSAMYSLQPILNDCDKITISKCMYPLKNIHDVEQNKENEETSPVNNFQQVDKIIKSFSENPEMNCLIERQEVLLKQLEDFKNQLQNLRTELKICNKPGPAVKTSAKIAIDESNLKPIVIKTCPSHFPYYLLYLQKIWANDLHLSVKCYTHSTTSMNDEIKKLAAGLQSLERKNSSIPQLNITLIWKTDVQSELILTPFNYPIVGDVNILRYLMRIGPKNFNYELYENPLDVDVVLNMAFCLSAAIQKTDRQYYLQQLNANMRKTQWLANRNNISVADVAVYSVIKQLTIEKDIAANMKKWLQRTEAVLEKS